MLYPEPFWAVLPSFSAAVVLPDEWSPNLSFNVFAVIIQCSDCEVVWMSGSWETLIQQYQRSSNPPTPNAHIVKGLCTSYENVMISVFFFFFYWVTFYGNFKIALHSLASFFKKRLDSLHAAGSFLTCVLKQQHFLLWCHDGYNQHCHDIMQPLKLQLIVIQLFKWRLHYHRHGQLLRWCRIILWKSHYHSKWKGA